MTASAIPAVAGLVARRPYTGRDFQAALQEYLQFISTTRPDQLNAFFEGDVARQVTELLAYLADGLSYQNDFCANESFLATARLLSSAVGHAHTFAYPIATPQAASATLVPTSFAAIPLSLTAAASFNEVQRVTVNGSPTAGAFTLSYGGETTTGIPYNATAGDVQPALRALSVIGGENVIVTGDSGVFNIEFVKDLARSSIDVMTANVGTLTSNETQTVSINGSPTGGTFTLSFGGVPTGAIAWNADPTVGASSVRALLEANVVLSGNIAVTGTAGVSYLVEFKNALGNGPMPDLVAVSSLTGGSSPTVTVAETRTGQVVSVTVDRAQTGADNALRVKIAAGFAFAANGLNWEVSEDTTINGNDVTEDNYTATFAVPVVEGKSFIETFTSSGGAFQEFTTAATGVIGEALTVRVDDAAGDAWTQVSSLALALPAENAYVVEYDAAGKATLRFGNGDFGTALLAGQTIYVEGRSGSGAAGNSGVGGLVTSIQMTAVRDGYAPITINVPMTNLAAATGGRGAETLEELRRNIPAWVRTVDKAITVEDYNTLSSTYESTNGSVARAASYLLSGTILSKVSGPDASLGNPVTVPTGTIVTIGDFSFVTLKELLIEEPAEQVLSVNPNLVVVYAWAEGTLGFEAASEPLLEDLRTYLQTKSVVTTTIRTLPGKTVAVPVTLGNVVYDTAYTKQEVSDAIVSAIDDFFFSDAIIPGASVNVSDLYGLVEAVPGVKNFTMTAPPADVAIAKDTVPIKGTLTFTLVPERSPAGQDRNASAFGAELFV